MDQSFGPMSLVVLVIPAVALRIAIRFLYDRRPLAAVDGMYTLLSMASTLMFLMAALGVVIGVWVAIIPLLLAVVMVSLMVLTQKRQAEHLSLMSSLATAVQNDIPLSESARAFADETLGDTGVRAMALAEAIERGQPLSTSIRTARLWMGTATKLAIRLGERLGVLGAALRQQIADSQTFDLSIRRLAGTAFYLACVVVVFFFHQHLRHAEDCAGVSEDV